MRSTNCRWSQNKAWNWQKKTEWLCGINYLPSYAQNTTEFWQEDPDFELVQKELAWACELGFNSCRIFIQYLVWKSDSVGFIRRFNKFLDISHKYGISVIPVLFDDCSFGDPPILDPFLGQQREPIPGMLQPSWTPSPGLKCISDPEEYYYLKKYVQQLLTEFRNDERILMWDLYNEPGFLGIGEKSLFLVKEVFIWAHEISPEQPVTVCIWNENNEEFNDIVINSSDVISFHIYSDHERLLKKIQELKQYGYPLICTEWFARSSGSKITRDLLLFRKENISCHFWGFVNGRAQGQFSFESRRGSSEPDIWTYDLLRNNGIPYDCMEIREIKKIINT